MSLNKLLSSIASQIQTLHATTKSYYNNPGNNPLVYRTIGEQLSLSVEKFQNRECLISFHERDMNRFRMTFAEVKQKIDQLAAGFIDLGLERGDRIGIWAPNNSHWYLTFFAAARAGLVSVGLNPAYKQNEIEYCLKKAKIKAVIAPEGFRKQNYYKILTEIVPELNDSKFGDLKSRNVSELKYIIIDAPDRKLP